MEKAIVRRLLSVLLIAALLVSSLAFAGSALPTEEGTDLPTVYVMGMGCTIYRPESDGTLRTIYPFDVNTDELLQIAKDNVQVYLRAVATGQWDEFCDLLCEVIIPYFEEFKLGPDGTPTDNSFADFRWSLDSLRSKAEKLPNGQYAINAFEFHYDFRLDPFVIADSLDQYIRDIKAVTGAEKVNLIGRCLGSNIVAAYLQKYGHAGLAQVLLLSSVLLGAPECSKSFCGEIRLDGDSIERFAYDHDLSVVNSLTGVEDLDQLLLSFITVFNDLGGLDMASYSFNNVVSRIYLKIFPRILIESFGTCPAFWSMVTDEDFEKAKETVFYGQDPEAYAELIEKIDNYHDSVQLQAKQILKAADMDGVPVHSVSKYGLQSIPVTDHADELSDGIVFVRDSSFGATTMEVDRRFHVFYMNRAKREGRLRYISADRQIDASTCWFPTKTWFIKDLAHGDFPDGVYGLLFDLLNHPDMTTMNQEDYAQFLIYDEEADQLLSLTASNQDTTERWNVPFFTALSQLLSGLFRLTVRLLQDRVNNNG